MKGSLEIHGFRPLGTLGGPEAVLRWHMDKSKAEKKNWLRILC